MDEFKKLSKQVASNLLEMEKAHANLYLADVEDEAIWEAYIKSFRPGDDPVFRDPDSTTHTCNADRAFIQNFGKIVSIEEGFEVKSIWDNIELDESSIYYEPVKALRGLVKSASIKTLFKFNPKVYKLKEEYGKDGLFAVNKEQSFKIYTLEEANKYEVKVQEGPVTFDHFHCKMIKAHVADNEPTIRSNWEANVEVFNRFFEEVTMEDMEFADKLFDAKALLKPETYQYKLKKFIELAKERPNDKPKQRLWSIKQSESVPYPKLYNELLGQLFKDVKDKGWDIAQLAYNKMADPANYGKAISVSSMAKLEEAEAYMVENHYDISFDRRFAKLHDIEMSEILHVNNKQKTSMLTMFKNVKAKEPNKAEKPKGKPVVIDEFMSKVLPNSESVEVYMESRLSGNLAAMTTSKHKEAKNPFKWDNHYDLTFNGNIAGKSLLTQTVSNAGGKTEGQLRGSLSWSEEGSNDDSDLDLHCSTPKGTIYYGHKIEAGGELDIDIIQPSSWKQDKGAKIAVENIVFKSMVDEGDYSFKIHNYNNRNSKGFKFELKVGDEMYYYTYDKPLGYKEEVKVATVSYRKGLFTIDHHLPNTKSLSGKQWGIDYEKFHTVNLVSLSPNYWGDKPQGDKSYIFMIDGCIPDSPLRTFHCQNLNQDLMKYKRELEHFGEANLIEPVEGQLCGLAFNANQKDELIVRVKGPSAGIYNVQF